MTQQQLLAGMKAWGHGPNPDPGKWTFGGPKRNEGGGFDDAGLVKLLTEETEDIAGAFGARNVSAYVLVLFFAPTIMKVIDVLGMEQGRA